MTLVQSHLILGFKTIFFFLLNSHISLFKKYFKRLFRSAENSDPPAGLGFVREIIYIFNLTGN